MQKEIAKIYDKQAATITKEEAAIVDRVIKNLNAGSIRVCEKLENGCWQVNAWVKQAILLYFKLNTNIPVECAPGGASWFDKVPNKFLGWNQQDFIKAGLRVVPSTFVRYGAYLAKSVVLMPCFVNIGAYVGESTMIDSDTTVGSCAQIGSRCHISSNVCIGGVLEPLQSSPVIVEDNCFIGAGSNILEGVIVKKNSVISAGCNITASTKIVNRATGEITYSEIPEGSVVVPGTIPTKGGPISGLALNCVVIVKTVDESTKNKTSINELLRD